jgi:hypothetical protein
LTGLDVVLPAETRFFDQGESLAPGQLSARKTDFVWSGNSFHELPAKAALLGRPSLTSGMYDDAPPA